VAGLSRSLRRTRDAAADGRSLRGLLARLVLAVGGVLIVMIGVAIAGTLFASSKYRDAAVLSVERQSAANQLLVDMLNAETSNRGYTLTGRGSYLEPYVQSRARYPGDLARLRRLVKDEPGLLEATDRVDAAVQLWLDEARRQIALRRQGRRREAIERVNEGLASNRFIAFRQEQNALVGEVSRLRQESLESADRYRNLTLILIGVAAALALFVTAMVARQLWRRMGGPLALLAQGVRRVTFGRFSDPVPQSDHAVLELANLTDGFNTMQTELEQQRDAVSQAARREAAQATERRMWETVQRGLLPTNLPQVPTLRMAARYQPAEPALLIGGDFYDAVVLTDGRLALVVGDLSGHGAQAAARAAGLRFSWRALLAVDPDPDVVMSALNAQLNGAEDRSQGNFASLLYALIDPEGSVEFAPAGHPPPILVSPECAEVLPVEEFGPLLGVFDSSRWPVSRAEIPVGGTFVVYTDGLVEARRGAELFGTEGACEVLVDQRRSALEERMVRLVDAARRWDSENLRDDVVVVAVERVVAPVLAEEAVPGLGEGPRAQA
jgi:serine phosphatase RsbU (regulator of sigma subunit)/CHASE3 domain sensor protein